MRAIVLFRYEQALGMISDNKIYYLLEESRFLNKIRFFLERGMIIDKRKFTEVLYSITVDHVQEEPLWTVAKILREDPLINVELYVNSTFLTLFPQILKMSDEEYIKIMETRIHVRAPETRTEFSFSSQDVRRPSRPMLFFKKK